RPAPSPGQAMGLPPHRHAGTSRERAVQDSPGEIYQDLKSRRCPGAGDQSQRLASYKLHLHPCQGRRFTLGQFDNRIRQVGITDVVSTGSHTDTMGCGKYIGNRVALWRNKLVAGHFEQLPVGVAEVDRVHKAAINVARIPDTSLIQPLGYLCIDGTRDGKGKMMEVTYAFWIRCRIVCTGRTD